MKISIAQVWSQLVEDCRNAAPLRFGQVMAAAIKAVLVGAAASVVMAVAIAVSWLAPKPAGMNVIVYLSLFGVGFVIIMLAGFYFKTAIMHVLSMVKRGLLGQN